jgi:hypothetical protein
VNAAIKAALADERCTLTLRWRMLVQELLDAVDALTAQVERQAAEQKALTDNGRGARLGSTEDA